MPPPLTPERFAALADAYGGAITRWPSEVRSEAHAMTADPACAEILRAAAGLDAHMGEWTVAPPSAALRRQIADTYPVSARRRLALWWAGLGIATALAGAATGTIAAAALPASHLLPDETTAFGSVAIGER